MLVAEVVRLAAIEVLCPTASIISGTGFPTLAGVNVLDSQEIEITDLDEGSPFTPVLSLYTANVASENRSGDGGGVDMDNSCVLEVVGELAVIQEDDGGDFFVDAMAGSDPDAKMTLATMMTQVRYLLEEAPAGRLFRQFAKSVIKYDAEPFAVPSLGLRWQRVTSRFTVSVASECIDENTGEPVALRKLVSLLPENSYALSRANSLLEQFTPPQNVPLITPDVMEGEGLQTIIDREDPS